MNDRMPNNVVEIGARMVQLGKNYSFTLTHSAETGLYYLSVPFSELEEDVITESGMSIADIIERVWQRLSRVSFADICFKNGLIDAEKEKQLDSNHFMVKHNIQKEDILDEH